MQCHVGQQQIKEEANVKRISKDPQESIMPNMSHPRIIATGIKRQSSQPKTKAMPPIHPGSQKRENAPPALDKELLVVQWGIEREIQIVMKVSHLANPHAVQE